MAAIKYTWTATEDEALIRLVAEKGEKKWCAIANLINELFGGSEKTGKQCRERWHNHLNPRLNKDSFTIEDEIKVFEYQRQYGNKWSLIAEHFEGRNDNFIKNCFYSAIRRNLRKYNKKKVPSKQLKGTISALMRNPVTRKILMNFPEHDGLETNKKEKKTEQTLEKNTKINKKEGFKASLKIETGKKRTLSNIGDITPTSFENANLGNSSWETGEADYSFLNTPINFFGIDTNESISTTPLLPELDLKDDFLCIIGKHIW